MDLLSMSVLGKVWSAVQPFVLSRAKELIQGSPVDRAIDAVDAEFTQLAGVREALRAWSATDEFLGLEERFKLGDRSLISDDVVKSFLAVTGFDLPEKSHTEAKKLLQAFLERLEREYLRDKDAHVIQAARTESLLREANESLARIAATQEQQFLALSTAHTPQVDVSSDEEQSNDPGLDQARALLLAGKFEAARILLEAARARYSATTAPGSVLFRIALNLGACALHRGDFAEAGREFKQALKLNHDEPKVLINLASLSLLEGLDERAIRYSRQATKLAPHDAEAAAVHLRSLHAASKKRAVNKFVTQHDTLLSESAPGLLALAELKYDESDFAAAAALYRRSAEVEPREHSAYIGLGAALASQVQQSLDPDPPILDKVPQATRNAVDEAEQVYSRALELVESQDLPRVIHAILVSRAAVRMMKLDFQSALTDIERALLIAVDTAALSNKGRTLLAVGRYEEALGTFNQIAANELTHDVQFLVAETHRALGHLTEAADRLSALLGADETESVRVQIAESLVETFHALHQDDKASRLASEFEERYPSSPDAFAIRAVYYSLSGDYDRAAEVLNGLLPGTAGHQHDRLALRLADVEFARDNFERASELYADLVDIGRNGVLRRKYLVALYKAGRLADALMLARRMADDSDDSPLPAEIEAACCDEIGDLPAAATVLQDLIARFPDRIHYRIRAAQNAARAGDQTQLRELTNGIDPRSVWDDPDALLAIARLHVVLGESKRAVGLAFRALRLDRDNPDVHLTFVALMLRAEQSREGEPQPDQVSVNSTVRLTRESQVRTYSILDDLPVSRERGEVGPHDPIAELLLGHKQGDLVTFGNDVFEVAAIQSPEVAAIQDLFARFTTLFPTHTGLQALSVPQDDPLSGIRPMLEQQERQTVEALDLYRTGILPLAALSRLTGRSVFKTWSGLVSDRNERLLVSGGPTGDLGKQIELLDRASGVSIDISAACTIAFLDLDESGDLRQGLATTQSALDAVREELLQLDTTRSSGTMGIRNGQFVFYEIGVGSVQEWSTFLTRVLRLLEALEVVPVRAVLELGRDTYDRMAHIVGRPAASAALVAAERRELLWADDLGLRKFALFQLGVHSTSSQAVLFRLMRNGLIDEAKYAVALAKLADARYHFLSIRHKDLMLALEQPGSQPSAKFLALLRSIEGPDCTPESAATIVADMARYLWTQPLPDERRAAIFDQCLVRLATNRPADDALGLLRAALRGRFALIPQQLQQVANRIDEWQEHRPLAVSAS